MNNYLEFEGQKYISSKRAAEISGYTTDYIGQLCRDGRVTSRMVGRAWFVAEDEIKNYTRDNPKDRERQKEYSKAVIPRNTARDIKSEVEKALRERPPETKQPDTQDDSLGELIKKILAQHQHTIIINQSPPTPQVSPPPEISPPIAQISPHHDLFPRIHKTPRIIESEIRETAGEIPEERQVKKAPLKITTVVPMKSEDRKVSGGKGTLLAVVSLLLIIISGIMSLHFFYSIPVIAQSELVSTSSSATISNGVTVSDGVAIAQANAGPIDKTFGALKLILMNIYDSLTNSHPKKSPTDPGGGPVDTGIAVVPSTGNSQKDQAIKTTLQESFSDEVKVWSDDKGGSGVIQPVFKKESNDSYIYVAVPIKK